MRELLEGLPIGERQAHFRILYGLFLEGGIYKIIAAYFQKEVFLNSSVLIFGRRYLQIHCGLFSEGSIYPTPNGAYLSVADWLFLQTNYILIFLLYQIAIGGDN